MTDLLYSDVEEDLRGSVRSMLERVSPPDRVLARVESDEPYDRELWRTLAVDMDLAGLAIPERYGGAGAGVRELAVVCEELGRAVAPVPFLGSAVVATATLLACSLPEPPQPSGDTDTGANAEALLHELAAGRRTAVLAVPFATAPGTPARGPGTPISAPGQAAGGLGAGPMMGESGGLTGTVASVAGGLAADVLLVQAGDGLYAVDTNGPGVERRPVVSLDLTRRLCDITFHNAPTHLLASGPAVTTAVDAGLTAGAALLASEQVGLAGWCLESTVEYVRVRYQFGRPVGSFQALKHRLADMWVNLTQARAVARYAAACLADGDPDTPVAVALAQAHCAPVAVSTAEECVQMHGGLGFTWEHPAHLYLKRAKADAIAFGGADRHRAALASLLDLPAAGQ